MEDNGFKKTPRGMNRSIFHIDDLGFTEVPKPVKLIPYKAARTDGSLPMTSAVKGGQMCRIDFPLTYDDIDYIRRSEKSSEDHQQWVESHSFPNRILIAANLYECGTTVLGVRHNGVEMHKQIAFLISVGKKPKGKAIQGFMDIFGQFKTREEAWIIASQAGQILPGRDKTPGILYSETIY